MTTAVGTGSTSPLFVQKAPIHPIICPLTPSSKGDRHRRICGHSFDKRWFLMFLSWHPPSSHKKSLRQKGYIHSFLSDYDIQAIRTPRKKTGICTDILANSRNDIFKAYQLGKNSTYCCTTKIFHKSNDMIRRGIARMYVFFMSDQGASIWISVNEYNYKFCLSILFRSAYRCNLKATIKYGLIHTEFV